MSILRRKKADPSSKVRKSDAESPARRDTPLERSRSDLAAVRQMDSDMSGIGGERGRPMSPKLQKRNPMSRENSGTWPLPSGGTPQVSTRPPKVVSGEDGRPFTADRIDGVGATGNGRMETEADKPNISTSRYTATKLSSVDAGDEAAVGVGKGGVGEVGKKKKFQALRKMFRLHD